MFITKNVQCFNCANKAALSRELYVDVKDCTNARPASIYFWRLQLTFYCKHVHFLHQIRRPFIRPLFEYISRTLVANWCWYSKCYNFSNDIGVYGTIRLRREHTVETCWKKHLKSKDNDCTHDTVLNTTVPPTNLDHHLGGQKLPTKTFLLKFANTATYGPFFGNLWFIQVPCFCFMFYVQKCFKDHFNKRGAFISYQKTLAQRLFSCFIRNIRNRRL